MQENPFMTALVDKKSVCGCNQNSNECKPTTKRKQHLKVQGFQNMFQTVFASPAEYQSRVTSTVFLSNVTLKNYSLDESSWSAPKPS